MRPLRLLTAAALAGVLVLPFTAPALCSAIHPSMATGGMAAGHGLDTVGDRDAMATCDFAECATAPVAPTVAIALLTDVRRVVAVTVSALPPSAADPRHAPITPPPKA